MGKDLFLNFGEAKEVFEEASDAAGIDIATLAFEGPEDRLNLTANTQPAILSVSIAALRVLSSEAGLRPKFLAGHSLGEYAALVCSGVLSFSDAVKTVKRRGELMQEAVPAGTGAMAAILGMEKEEVALVCEEAGKGELVSSANFNSPGQIVIAGARDAVGRAVELAKEKGAKRAILLPVSVPSHCALMAGAGEALGLFLEGLELGDFAVPVVSNVEAKPYPGKSSAVDLLVRQMSFPVRWDDSIACLRAEGVVKVVEVGPGKVLSGLVKRIDKTIATANVEDLASLEKLETELKGTL